MEIGKEKLGLIGDAAEYRRLTETMPALMWIAGADKSRAWFNQRWLEFTGRTQEQEAGLGWVDGLHPDDVERCLGQYLGCFEQRQPFRMEYRIRHADGRYRWLLDCADVRFDEQARFTGYVGCCLDITERKAAEDHLRTLSEVVEQSPSSIIITDLQGVIQYVNPGFTRMTGYTPEETIGRTPGIVSSGAHPAEFFAELWSTILAGSFWRGEIQNRKKNGEAYWERVSISPIRDDKGEISNFLAIKVDITDRKLAEATLRAREKELGELYAALQTVREEERRSLARELHDELGQVMTALRIDLNWLQARLPAAEPHIVGKLAAMNQLVDRTVDTVRRISEDMRPGMLDDLGLTAAIENHVAKFEEQTGIACGLASSHDDFGLDDKTSIAVFRIVQEALTNAARHSGASRVAISLGENADEMLLTVQDNWHGFAAASPADRKTFGLLGMRERVAILGGRIAISSEPDMGVRIEVGIPKHGGTE